MPHTSLPFGWSSNKWILLITNVLGGALLIFLSHTIVFPLEKMNFFFFSLLGFLFSLYRPGWAFLFLIGMLPYEIINISPEGFPFIIRPYQWILMLLILALGSRYILKRFPVEKLVLNKWDLSLILFSLASLLSAIVSDGKIIAIKLSFILLSFILLFFVTRLFVRSFEDIKMFLPFLLSSFIVVSSFAIVQNVLFLNGQESYEVMAGRPNSTFTEADWLGFYVASLIVILSSIFLYRSSLTRRRSILISSFLVLGYITLLLTVSRSAWIATFFGVITLFFFSFLRGNIWGALKAKRKKNTIQFLFLSSFIFFPFILALFFVLSFSLSPFHLFDRTSSVVTGEQEITVSCEIPSSLPILLPKKINTLEELSVFHCRHITLEEINTEQEKGRFISTVYRNDPNVDIRKNIYEQVRAVLMKHPFFGIGFGNIASILGTDERGSGLNASNIFLEIWLGSGIIGLCSFLFFFLGIAWYALKNIFSRQSLFATSLLALWITFTLFNLFNTGLFLGFFFVFLACLTLIPYEYE